MKHKGIYTNSAITKAKLSEELVKLGVKQGEVVYIRSDLKRIGKIRSGNRQDYLNSILDVIGEQGTLIAPAFTNTSFIFRNKKRLFTTQTKSYCGALSNMMIKHKNSKRSRHPSNSFVAIGPKAEWLLRNHDEESFSFDPIKKMIKVGAKMILVGCIFKSPGFHTVHLAEKELGINKRIIFPQLNTIYYKKKNKILLYKKKFKGGCNKSGRRFYRHYIEENVLEKGRVGNALAVIGNAESLYRIDIKVLNKNPQILICGSIDCFLCNMRRWDNFSSWPKYLMYKYQKLRKVK